MSQLLTANKVNNVWQLSRLNDPRETRADPGYNRSRRGGDRFYTRRPIIFVVV